MSCQHLTTAGAPAPQATYEQGCQDCVAMGHRDWVHLRVCQECGHVGCCDSSPAKHATAHYRADAHPVIRSYEPGETWRWCYPDNQLG
jgi:Zn ribbon nucleic-acid-binding protein